MAESPCRITSFSKIDINAILKNGQLLTRSSRQTFEIFAEETYRKLKIAYPKFHKMDDLSKLGFLTAEMLLKDISWKEKYAADRMGVVLANSSSSLDTDIKYYNNVKKGVASPAVFVYSLPNIVIGEICIRNGIKGENTFFISDQYDIRFQVDYVNSLFATGAVDACICGWVELIGEKYRSFLYLVERNEDEGLMPHNVENVETIYN